MTIASTTTAQSMIREAQETPTQTKTEAAKGDQQAVRKLASEQGANQNTQPPADIVDSDKGRLSAKA